MDDRLDAIEARLARIEAQLASQGAPRSNTTPPQPRPQPAALRAPATVPARIDAEQFFGGRVLLAVGAVALLLGVAFFLKYAFDNGWIGPSGRVAIGLIAGAALLYGSQRMRGKTQTAFSEGVTALGAGILYLSLWAAGNGFHLVPIAVSFAGMALVTASLIALAKRRDSEITAAWGLLGGFLTPLLNATSFPAYLNLYVYLAILDLALIFVPRQREWSKISPFAFVFTQLYLFETMLEQSASGRGPSLGLTIAAATVFLVLFAVRPVFKSRGGAALGASDVAMLVASACAYYLALHVQLYAHHRMALTAAVIALAAAYVALGRIDKAARPIYAAIALALVTGGIAIAFKGNTMTDLWAVEGALLVWAGVRMQFPMVRIFGVVAFCCSGLGLLIDVPLDGALFANDRFATLAIVGISLGAARFAGYRSPAALGRTELSLFRFGEILAHVCIVSAFSNEFWKWSGHNELAITLFWLLYGAALLGFGFARNSIFTRFEALALLGLAVLKALVVDMSTVDPAIRIISFLALGVVLLAASYLYLRNRRPVSTEPEA